MSDISWGDAAKLVSTMRDITKPTALDYYLYKENADSIEKEKTRVYTAAVGEMNSLYALDKEMDGKIGTLRDNISTISASAEVLNNEDYTSQQTLSKVLEENDYDTYQKTIAMQDSLQAEVNKKLEYYKDLTEYNLNLKEGARMAKLQQSKYFTGAGGQVDLQVADPKQYEAKQAAFMQALEGGQLAEAAKLKKELRTWGWDLNQDLSVDRSEYEIAIAEIMKNMRTSKMEELVAENDQFLDTDPNKMTEEQMTAIIDRDVAGINEGFWDQVGSMEKLNKSEMTMEAAKISLQKSKHELNATINKGKTGGVDSDPVIAAKARGTSLKESHGEYWDFITDQHVWEDMPFNVPFMTEMRKLHDEFTLFAENEVAPYSTQSLDAGDGKSKTELAHQMERYQSGLKILNKTGKRHFIVDMTAKEIEKEKDRWHDLDPKWEFRLGDWGKDYIPGTETYPGEDIQTSMQGQTIIPGLEPEDEGGLYGKNVFNIDMMNRIKNRTIVKLTNIESNKNLQPAGWDDMSDAHKGQWIKEEDFKMKMQRKERFEWLVKNHYRYGSMDATEASKHDAIKEELTTTEVELPNGKTMKVTPYYMNSDENKDGEHADIGHPFLDF